MPNEYEIGRRLSGSASRIFREHVVRPVSSSKVALGRVAVVFGQLSSDRRERKLLLGDRTVFQCGNHCDERGVERISVVVDACRVDVQHPGCTFGVNTQR
jgi:hypothetical protein